jgi:branched-chain amino acid transport system permease protein
MSAEDPPVPPPPGEGVPPTPPAQPAQPAPSEDAEGRAAGGGPQIGVDEWVGRSGAKHDAGTGLRLIVNRVGDRVGWWPRLGLALVAGLAIGQFLLTNANLQQTAFNCMVYAILALGLNIAVGWAGMLDLGYIAFFGFGAYGYSVFSSAALGSNGAGGAHLPFIEIVPIVLVIAGAVGVFIGLIALRLDGDYLAIVTLFVGQAFVEIATNVDPQTFGGVNGLFDLDSVHDFGGQITTTSGYFRLGLIVLVGLAAILHLLDTSRTGRAWRAIKDDPLAAGAMTIPVDKLRIMAFSFGSIVGAFGGVLFAGQQGSVFPTDFNSNVLILIYACLVLGGTGSITGAIAGGIAVTAAEQILSSPTDSAYLFYGLILVALVVKVRPWRLLAAVVAAIVAFGLAAHAIAGAISSTAVGGSPGSGGWIRSLVSHWVVIPSRAATYGNLTYAALICALVLVVQLHGVRRMIAVVPTVYLAACCWESKLITSPAVTTQIMLGAILIVTMAARPQGLFGKRQVEIV